MTAHWMSGGTLRRLARPAMLLALIAASLAPAWAEYDPPSGTGAFYDLASPEYLMEGPSAASSSSPYADALNPAASGFSQRPVLDLSYIGLAGFGGESGFGSALNLGASIPSLTCRFRIDKTVTLHGPIRSTVSQSRERTNISSPP